MHLLDRSRRPSSASVPGPARGRAMRSCFAMTEPPPGAGADPRCCRRAAERGDARVVDRGDKWYISGADGAAFAICMAPGASDAGATMFLVDATTPGSRSGRSRVRRRLPGRPREVAFRDCACPDAVLGAVGKGFRYAQVRLAPARLTHCMRWLGVGAARARDRRAVRRRARGLRAAARRARDGAGDARRLGDRDRDRRADDLARRAGRSTAASRREQSRWPRSMSRKPSSAWSTARCRSAARTGSPTTCRSRLLTSAPVPDLRRSLRGPPHGDRPRQLLGRAARPRPAAGS